MVENFRAILRMDSDFKMLNKVLIGNRMTEKDKSM